MSLSLHAGPRSSRNPRDFAMVETAARCPWGSARVRFELTRALPHGHLAAVSTMAKSLGLRELLCPACEERGIACALILARVVHPRPKLATTKWWADTTLAADFGLAEVGTDEIYEAMDWLRERQRGIEVTLTHRHLGKKANPMGLAYFDLSSSWVEGTHNELAARGYSRDKKRGVAQIEYGLLTDKDGRPVAIEVFKGNTADPTAFISTWRPSAPGSVSIASPWWATGG